jgi:hypothetical protein
MREIEIPRVLSVHGWPVAGITPARVRTELRRGQWRRLTRGYVLTRPEEPQRCDWAEVGLAAGGNGSALSGWDALRLRGLGDRREPGDPVLVLARRGGNRAVGNVRIRGAARPYEYWRTSPLDAHHADLRVVTLPRALSDFAATQPPTAVRAVVTAAIQRGRCTPADLARELDASARHGSSALRRALSDVLDGARSVAEAQAVDRLRRAAVPSFEVNVRIVDAGDRLLAVADVLWRELRAVLEIDSREFHFSERDWKAMARHNLLTAHGLALIHYPPSVITDPAARWTDDVVAFLGGRARERGVAYLPSGQVLRSRAPLRLGQP